MCFFVFFWWLWLWIPVRWAPTHNDAGGPGVEEEHGADQEDAGQHHADGEQEPVAQADVLLPEKERVAIGVAGEPLAAVVAADGPDALDGFHKLRRLSEAVEVERKLCVFDRFSGGNWGKVRR